MEFRSHTPPTPDPANPIPPAASTASEPAPPATTDPLAWVPEQYRSDPTKLLQDYEERGKKVTELEPIGKWYRENEAWLRAHQNHRVVAPEDYELLEQVKRERQAQPPRQETQPFSAESIDWEDPQAAKKAYDALSQQIESKIQALENNHTMTQQKFEKERDTILELMKHQNDLYEIERDDLHDFLGSKVEWKPRVNSHEIVNYANQHGLRDLRAAAKELYEPQRLELREQEAFKRGEANALQRLQAQQRTTETTGGTPIRTAIRRDAAPVRGYGAAGRDDLLTRMEEAITRRQS